MSLDSLCYNTMSTVSTDVGVALAYYALYVLAPLHPCMHASMQPVVSHVLNLYVSHVCQLTHMHLNQVTEYQTPCQTPLATSIREPAATSIPASPTALATHRRADTRRHLGGVRSNRGPGAVPRMAQARSRSTDRAVAVMTPPSPLLRVTVFPPPLAREQGAQVQLSVSLVRQRCR
jgi:hypothetical protein